MLMENIHDESLRAPRIIFKPGEGFRDCDREWQGIPGIERTPAGRLYACWYSGGTGEGAGNYVLLVRSDDDGETWSEPLMAIAPEGRVRAYDPCLWTDPSGKLRFFWAQSYEWNNGRAGVWCISTDEPESETPAWTEPVRICNGVMMNKPTVLSNGDWLLPAAVWGYDGALKLPELKDEQLSSVVAGSDQGKTWSRRGGADVPCRSFDEHMIVEKRDGTLWMLVRTRYGIGESFSSDGGFTWSRGRASAIEGPCSRFFIRRLASGRLVLVNHYNFVGRSHLTARLSDDDGETWKGALLLDERKGVSYPDGFQAPDGTIYVVYDHERYKDKEILFASFTEDDVLAGRPGEKVRLKKVINKL